jgi:cystathionine beta-lyase
MKKDTKLVHGGRHPEQHFGAVNPPVYHASTITYPTLAAWQEARGDRYNRVIYGRFGTPTTKAFEEAMAGIEGAERCMALSSGLAACSAAVLSAVGAGAHILVQNSAYFPVRNLCDSFLTRFGVRTTYFDPAIGEDIAALIEPETTLIYLEAPGSLTFEMPDVPAITAVARDRGIRTALDNTWATPLYYRPLEHGVDMSVNACTKYIVGHSDGMLGSIALSEDLFAPVRDTANFSGNSAGSDEAYLGLRGLRTLSVRLQRHGQNARIAAEWFQKQPEVAQVLYPALPDDPGHAIWQRDFDAATGLFTVCFNPLDEKQVEALVDNLDLFGLGASWGGYECLVLPFDARHQRTAVEWNPPGPTIRFHIGLDDPDDILEDLEKGFAHMRKA